MNFTVPIREIDLIRAAVPHIASIYQTPEIAAAELAFDSAAATLSHAIDAAEAAIETAAASRQPADLSHAAASATGAALARRRFDRRLDALIAAIRNHAKSQEPTP